MKRTATLFAALCVILLGVNVHAAELPDTVGRDCIAITALYAETGQFLDCVRMNVPSGERIPDAATFDDMPSGAYTTTFLLDSATLAPIPIATATPILTATPTPQPSADTAYALLYDDGTLVFQSTATPDVTRGTLTNTYEVDLQGYYDIFHHEDYDLLCDTPWYNERESITTVDFADTIAPVSTAYWFYECHNLLNITNLNRLNTSNVTNMDCMFCACESLTALELSYFDTSEVESMHAMFSECPSLITLDMSHFDTSNVEAMSMMFYSCSGLTTLDMSGFDTSNVWNMEYMFNGCSRLTVLDVSGWNTSNVWTMFGMFDGCSGLNTIYSSEKFLTNQVEYADHMFSGCVPLVGGAGTKWSENHRDGEYARIDNPPDAPGYFTRKS